MKSVLVRAAARSDIDAALAASPDPDALRRAVAADFERIGRFPEIGGESTDGETREWVMTRYPFRIVYVI